MKAVTILLALSCAVSAAQERMQRGEAHAKLDFLVGSWTVSARMHMPDGVHAAEHDSEIRWLPDGVWLEEHATMRGTPLGDMHGSSRTAWDADNQEYVRTWIDSQSHVTLPMRGRFVDERTLEFTGSFEWTDGRVFHQRLKIRKEDEGWSQRGWMGLDPDALRLNHEDRARARTPERAHDAPPAWFREHMAFLTKGSGRWITDNASYKSENEPYDAYGTEWHYGIGEQSVTGRLFGLIDGEDQGTFWEFRTIWDPVSGEVQARQYGGNGAIGVGPIEYVGDGTSKMVQTFTAPDGTSSRVGHESIERDGEHVTRSFDVDAQGHWTPRRSYTWKLDE